LVIATALGWHDLPSIVLAIVLSFVFGYGLTVRKLLAGGVPFRRAALFWGSLALALAVAFVVALPVNRWLVGRGLGHAVMHGEHGR
jgi:hypothetical protein